MKHGKRNTEYGTDGKQNKYRVFTNVFKQTSFKKREKL
jgi:hypothetical protein